MKAPAVPLALVAVYRVFFNSRLLEQLSWVHFYYNSWQVWFLVGVLGMQLNIYL